MSGTPTLQLPAFLLREEDLVAEFDPVAVAVVQAGGGDGMGVLEAFIRCCFKPAAVERTLKFYLEDLPVMGPTFYREAALIKTILRGLMRKVLILDAGAAVRAAVRDGMLTVKGLPLGQFKSVQLDTALVMKGELDAIEETVTDYRTGHPIGSVRLVPTPYAKRLLAPKFGQAKAFTAALDAVGEARLKGTGWRGKPLRQIGATKGTVYGWLESQPEYKGRFSTLGYFRSQYSREGRWAQDLPYDIEWLADNSRDRD